MKWKGVSGRGHSVGKGLAGGWAFRVQKEVQREWGRGRPDPKCPLGTDQDTWQSLAKVISAPAGGTGDEGHSHFPDEKTEAAQGKHGRAKITGPPCSHCPSTRAPLPGNVLKCMKQGLR